MAIIDQKGKFLGLINTFDLLLLISVIAIVIGIISNLLGYSSLNKKVKAEGIAQIKVGIRGARVLNPKIFEKHKKVFIIIRNQPHANLDVIDVKVARRPLIFYDQAIRKPIKVDNFEDNLITDVDITLQGNAQFTNDDPPSIVMGGNKVKAGIPVELETLDYKFNGSIIDVKMNGVN
jgi:hypothetical protein